MNHDRFRNPLPNQTLKYPVTGDGKYIRETVDGPIFGHVILEASPRIEGGGLQIVSRTSTAEIPSAEMPQVFDGIHRVIEDLSSQKNAHLHLTIAIVGGSHAEFVIPSYAFMMAAAIAMKKILDKCEWVDIP